MISQEDLEVQGSRLSELAHTKGLRVLSDDEAKTLSLYEDWKDGADWHTIIDFWRSIQFASLIGEEGSARNRLKDLYGYKE